MAIQRSGRGFAHGDEIPSTYGGYVKAYESSAASGPHVWVMVKCPANLNDPAGPSVEATAHLTLENARSLHEQLGQLIDEHYQVPPKYYVAEDGTIPCTNCGQEIVKEHSEPDVWVHKAPDARRGALESIPYTYCRIENLPPDQQRDDPSGAMYVACPLPPTEV